MRWAVSSVGVPLMVFVTQIVRAGNRLQNCDIIESTTYSTIRIVQRLHARLH
jgi:hypothetical protein